MSFRRVVCHFEAAPVRAKHRDSHALEMPMRPLLLSTLAASLLLAACANPARRDAAGQLIVIPPGHERAYRDYHYAPAVRVGEHVFVSGIPSGGPGSEAERLERMLQRLKSVLEASGATLADVVEVTTYHTNVATAQEFQAAFARFLKVHSAHFTGHYPAWSAVGVTALLSPGAEIELSARAIVGSGRAVREVQRVE